LHLATRVGDNRWEKWGTPFEAMKVDIVVLGAGIIGTSVALSLQKKGRAVTLIDRAGIAMETSFGNTGIIQREAVYPYAFPRSLSALLRIGANRTLDVHYQLRALPSLVPFLWKYWCNSRSSHYRAIARHYATLIKHSTAETRTMAVEAGVETLLRHDGWIKVFRTKRTMDTHVRESEGWQREFGINACVLDQVALYAREPFINRSMVGGLQYIDSDSVVDPAALVQGFASHFSKLGGQFCKGEAQTLKKQGKRWQVQTENGPVEASSVVIALGPWSHSLISKFGCRMLLGVKRGYHMHYRPRSDAILNHPVLDVEHGYVLAPMARGIRLTTGAEFAFFDAPKMPVQLERAEPVARTIFPLGSRLDPEPWMGRRPCTPDMLPVIGPAPRHESLWFAFGHGHQGLTLGAVTGKLLAEMIVGEDPFIDPQPFRADRPELL
jgi:D-amino-acid dehydrogenase